MSVEIPKSVSMRKGPQKRSLGRDIFAELVARADFVIESFLPGRLGELSLGYDTLRRIQPRLVVASITPFGQTGPYARFRALDIEIMAMSGCMSLVGDPDK
ncbi:MAG: hypothetical protein E6J89_18105, partial [Deltaproteobacteria bacterium]